LADARKTIRKGGLEMEYLLSCLLLSLLCILQVNAQEKSDRDFENLTGPVHRVRVERALVTCDSGKCNEGKRIQSIVDTYDLKGNLVSSNRNRYDPKNPLQRLTHYPFGDEPAVIQTDKVTHSGDAYTYTFIFDDLARRSEWLSYSPLTVRSASSSPCCAQRSASPPRSFADTVHAGELGT
jgi:hypothetical protein